MSESTHAVPRGSPHNVLNGSEAQYTNAQVSKFSMQAFGAAVVFAFRINFAQHRKYFSSICMSRAV